MAALELYYFEPNMQTSSWDSEVDNPWKKLILLTLQRMPSQSQVFLLSANFKSDWMTSHTRGLVAKTVSKWRSPKSLISRLFLPDSRHFRGLTLVSGKAEFLLAFGEDKESKLFAASCSFKSSLYYPTTWQDGKCVHCKYPPYKALGNFPKALYGGYLQCTHFPSCHASFII